jgi:hypothetical protein
MLIDTTVLDLSKVVKGIQQPQHDLSKNGNLTNGKINLIPSKKRLPMHAMIWHVERDVAFPTTIPCIEACNDQFAD